MWLVDSIKNDHNNKNNNKIKYISICFTRLLSKYLNKVVVYLLYKKTIKASNVYIHDK